MSKESYSKNTISSTYLRGGLALLALLLLGKLAELIASRLYEIVGLLFEDYRLTVWSVCVLFLSLPFLLGILSNMLIEKHKSHRNVRAFRELEGRLTNEFRLKEGAGYEVVMIDWPSAEVRTVGVLTSRFNDPRTGSELASVFISNTPDPSSGAIKIVEVSKVTRVQMNLNNLTTFYLTYGTANPI